MEMKSSVELNYERWISQLSTWFGVLRDRVCRDTKVGRTDLNKMCESMFIPVLNRIYGWSLVNANDKVANVTGIDLRDCTRGVVVQVTSDKRPSKVRHTILRTAKSYPGSDLYMFYIGENPPKAWNNKTFKADAKGYRFPVRKITFSCPDNIITLEKLQNRCENDPALLEDVHAICQRYFNGKSLHIEAQLKKLSKRTKEQSKLLKAIYESIRQTPRIVNSMSVQGYDAALKSLSPLAELLGHVDLVRAYCKAYRDENDVYRWPSIRAIMGNQVTFGLASLANVFITLRECLFTESDASEVITDLEKRAMALNSCADALQRLPLRKTDQYTQIENEAILESVRRSYDALDGFWTCSERLICMIIGRTTNPCGSAELFRSWEC